MPFMTAQVGAATAVGGSVWDKSAAQPSRWGGVLAMALCAFCTDCLGIHAGQSAYARGCDHDLRVSEGFVGMGVAISGAFAVLISLSISLMAGSMNRKKLLLGLTVLMVVCRGSCCAGTELWGIHGRSGADRGGHRRVLVLVGGHCHATGAVQPSAACSGHL